MEIIVKVTETRVVMLKCVVEIGTTKQQVIDELKKQKRDLVYQHPNIGQGPIDFYSYEPQPMKRLGTHEAINIEITDRKFD